MPDSIAQYAVTLLPVVPVDAPYKYSTECILASFASKRSPDSKFPKQWSGVYFDKELAAQRFRRRWVDGN